MWDVEGRFVRTYDIAKQETDLHERLKAYQEGERQLASDFWTCCAVDALRYLDELQQRVGGGSDHSYDQTNEWLKSFVREPLFGSKEFAPLDGMKCVLASLQLTFLHQQLERKIKSEKGAK